MPTVTVDVSVLETAARNMTGLSRADTRRMRAASEKAARPMIGEIKMRATSHADSVALRGSRIAVGMGGDAVRVGLYVGAGSPNYGRDYVRQREFGADRDYLGTVVAGPKRGGRYKRHTQRQLPPMYRDGRMVYPTVKTGFKTLTSAWLGALVIAYRQILEG